MSDVVRFRLLESAVLVEVDSEGYGTERVARDTHGIIQASKGLNEAIYIAKPTIVSIGRALDALARSAAKWSSGGSRALRPV